MRLFAVSDLHTDVPDNFAMVRALSRSEYRDDVLLVAGDLSDDLSVLLATLAELKERFREVFFVPGNHDLWVRRQEVADSLAKFALVKAGCVALGVQVQALTIGSVRIVPIYSWYVDGFMGPAVDVPAVPGGWADLHHCRWPGATVPAEYFMAMNPALGPGPEGTMTVTLSHFLPRPDLLPPLALLTFKALGRVCGDRAIEAALRQVGSTVHVFGHTHINGDRVFESVRYVQCALGYPRERRHLAADGHPTDSLPLKELLAFR